MVMPAKEYLTFGERDFTGENSELLSVSMGDTELTPARGSRENADRKSVV